MQSERLQQSISATIRPNPVASSGILQYHLTTPSSVTIIIHDALGRIVSRRVAGAMHESGGHQMLIETEGLTTGLYMCTITAGGVTQSVRFVVAQ